MDSGGGAQSTKADDTSSFTTYAPWYNDLNKQQGGAISNQIAALPGLTDQIMAGGQAPTQGVWNGGQTNAALTPIQPQQNVSMGMPMKSGLGQ